MDTKQLKQRILDLAIRGKLVPQDPNDEPASVLLERIRAEKEQLIAQGKLKKSKTKTSDKPHYENVPFEIPESWEWVTLGEISNYGQTKHAGVDKINDIDWVLELEDIEKDSAQLVQKLNRKERNISGVRSQFEKGQILYSKLRTYLNKVLVAPSNGYCTTEIIPFSCFGSINNHYITQVLRSKYFIDYTILCCYGCKMPRLGTDDAKKGLIPLPPINEQKRIVSTIEKWFELIDKLENSKKELQEAVKQVKAKVLELAIHGKLVPQDPNDEPAIELLKRINPNFKPCDTSHYENLPQGWCTCSFKDAFDITMGSSPEGSTLNHENDGIEFHQGKINFTEKYLAPSNIYTNSPTKFGEAFSILLCVRAPVGIVNITQRKICIGRGLCTLLPKKDIDLMFAFYAMQTYQDIFEAKATGTTFKAISGSTIRDEMFLLPPYTEQIRIRKKLDELWSIIDSIRAEL